MKAMDYVARFESSLNVSRETFDKIRLYAELLERWQKSVNLVSPASLPEMWERHFLDSGQLVSQLPAGRLRLVDFGSGAGFPGLVLAVMRPDLDVHLIESDQKKAVFLMEVSRVTETPVTVWPKRVGDVDGLNVDVVTARALAPLDELLDMTLLHVKPSGMGLFMKGADAKAELETARKSFDFQAEIQSSLTSSEGAIVRVLNLKRRA